MWRKDFFSLVVTLNEWHSACCCCRWWRRR
jgi:hypothetical protein